MILPGLERRAAATIALSLVLSACSGDGPSESPHTYPAVTPPPGDGFADLMWRYSGQGDPATSPIDIMWQKVLGADYESPTAVVPHEPGTAPHTACADLRPPDEWRDYAGYCHRDQTISYDSTFLRAFYDRVDPQAALAILAHEWGHHVQDRMGRAERSIQNELAADCYAGVFASEEELAGNAEPASLSLIAEAFYDLGNSAYSESRWFVSEEHGSPFMRYTAWSLGYTMVKLGPQVCGGYSQWQPGQTAEIGSYRLLELPGHPGVRDEAGAYRVEAETLPAFIIEYLDVPAGFTTVDKLEALLRGRYRDPDQRRVFGPHTFQRDRDNTAWVHLSSAPDDHGRTFARHAAIGLLTSPADPGRGVLVTVHGEGTVPVDDSTANEDEFDRVLEAGQVLLTLAERLCAPHESVDGDVYNHYCRDGL